MQQRQLRLGDILDDYCPRERRLTNHAVVAMVGDDVKQTRCTTCDAEHEYKHAKVPRQRKKSDTPAALYAQALASGPKKVAHESRIAAPTRMSHQSTKSTITTSHPRADTTNEHAGGRSQPHVDHDAEETRAIADPELDDDDATGRTGGRRAGASAADSRAAAAHGRTAAAGASRARLHDPPAGRAHTVPAAHDRGQFQNNRSGGNGNGNGNGNVAGPMRGARGQNGGRPALAAWRAAADAVPARPSGRDPADNAPSSLALPFPANTA